MANFKQSSEEMTPAAAAKLMADQGAAFKMEKAGIKYYELKVNGAPYTLTVAPLRTPNLVRVVMTAGACIC